MTLNTDKGDYEWGAHTYLGMNVIANVTSTQKTWQLVLDLFDDIYRKHNVGRNSTWEVDRFGTTIKGSKNVYNGKVQRIYDLAVRELRELDIEDGQRYKLDSLVTMRDFAGWLVRWYNEVYSVDRKREDKINAN
jgi:hypothetical protein